MKQALFVLFSLLCFSRWVWSQESWMSEDAGKSEKAAVFYEDELKKDLEVSPNSLYLRDLLGQWYFREKRYWDAWKQFETAISISPFSVHSYYGAGKSREMLGDYRQALQEYSRGLERSSYRFNYRRAICYNNLHQYRRAVQCLREAERISDKPGIHYALAVSLAGLFRYREALQELSIGRDGDSNFQGGQEFFSSSADFLETQREWEKKAQKQFLFFFTATFFLSACFVSALLKIFRIPIPWKVKFSLPTFRRKILTVEDF